MGYLVDLIYALYFPKEYNGFAFGLSAQFFSQSGQGHFLLDSLGLYSLGVETN